MAVILPSTCSLCQVTYSKLLRRHISEQHNLTIGLLGEEDMMSMLDIVTSDVVNCNSFSLDWGSALNSSTVLGDVSDSFSPRTSSDWFFRE